MSTASDQILTHIAMVTAQRGAAVADVGGYTNTAIAKAEGMIKPNITAPDVTTIVIPEDAITTRFETILNQVDVEVAKLTDKIYAMIASNLASLAGDMSGNLFNEELSAAEQDAIWSLATGRMRTEFQTKRYEMSDEWAKRGFSLPPGALVSGMNRLGEAEALAAGLQSNEVAKMAAEYRAKFKLAQLEAQKAFKIAAMQQLAVYMGAIIDAAKFGLEAQKIALENAKIYADIIVMEYEERIRVRNTNLGIEFGKYDRYIEKGKLDFSYDSAKATNTVHAAVGGASASASVASAAFTSISTLSQLAAVEQTNTTA